MAGKEIRKTFRIKDEMLAALRQFADERGCALEELAHEAFSLLLRKHNRPRNLKEALKMSLRSFALNDNGSPRKRVRK